MAEIALGKLAEHESYWSLPINGLRIIQLRLDYAFGMEIGDAQSEFSLRVNTAFTLKNADGTKAYAVERLLDVDPVIRLFNAEIAETKAFKNGCLEMTFLTNTVLSVEPDPQFESWELVGSNMNETRVLAMPGGELAIWSE